MGSSARLQPLNDNHTPGIAPGFFFCIDVLSRALFFFSGATGQDDHFYTFILPSILRSNGLLITRGELFDGKMMPSKTRF
uniref:Uncharacterized protein n=1 Tax=Siphoviridae sp. ctDmR33 TaxID=2825389 RepID=A0A8S5UX46_9CAUD|nr:MAG TPA: hypothetical protein [Siphoviridae sp. ctDmR33]